MLKAGLCALSLSSLLAAGAAMAQDVPGIAEELRRVGSSETPGGMLSRGRSGVVGPVAGITAGALIVNLPGSPKAVAAGIPIVLSVARHVIDQLAGGDHA